MKPAAPGGPNAEGGHTSGTGESSDPHAVAAGTIPAPAQRGIRTP
jgi:hypothetical protein